jgi:DNA-binding transcriptional MerR regulator
MNGMSIGELARKVSVKIPTIRYYEEIGILPEAERTEGGRRTYGKRDVERLNFVRHARDLGFPMEDVRALIDMIGQPQDSCHAADSIARRNLQTIEFKIAALESLRSELRRMVDTCAKGRVKECRVLQVLADHDQCTVRDHVRL